jgi:hypothetical protein
VILSQRAGPPGALYAVLRAALAAVPILLFAGSYAFAQRPHVVILGPAADNAAVVRMRGELAVLGIDVDVLVPAQRTDLEAVARRLGAIAALRVETTPPAVVVWVDPAVGAPGAPPEVRVAGGADDAALLALRAVEVLRAKLVKVPLALPPPDRDADAGLATEAAEAGAPDASVPAAATVQSPATIDAGAQVTPPPTVLDSPTSRAERPHPVGLSVAPALLWNAMSGVPLFGVRGGVAWDFLTRLGVELHGLVPATNWNGTAEGGSVNFRVGTLGGGLRGSVTDPAAPVSLMLGLGAEALWISFASTAQMGSTAHAGTSWFPAPYLSAAAVYRPHPVVALRLDIAAAAVLKKFVFRVDDQETASFGVVAVSPSLGLEVRP